MLLLNLLNISLKQVNLLLQSTHFLIAWGRIGCHHYSRSGSEFGFVIVIANLYTLRFENGIVGVVHVQYPFSLIKVPLRIVSKLPSVKIEELFVDHGSIF